MCHFDDYAIHIVKHMRQNYHKLSFSYIFFFFLPMLLSAICMYFKKLILNTYILNGFDSVMNLRLISGKAKLIYSQVLSAQNYQACSPDGFT